MSALGNDLLEKLFATETQNNRLQARRSVRILQTDLTDEDFSRSNLVILDPTFHGAVGKILLDPNFKWNDNTSIVTKGSAYSFLAHQEDANVPFLQQARPAWWNDFTKRIAELKESAEEEGITICAGSMADAVAFLRRAQIPTRPGVFLLENGNLRLLWANDGDQIGLQFQGNNVVQYVCFKKHSDGFIERSVGNRKAEGIRDFINALGLSGLLQSAKLTS